MNRIILAIYSVAILPGCTSITHRSKYGEVVTYQGYITVIGSAKEDSKGGALVEMDMNHRYFIRGLTPSLVGVSTDQHLAATESK